MVSDVERIAVLETKNKTTEDRLKNIEEKLDELLTLKSKGIGAVWLIGIIFGSSLLGAWNWIQSIIHK